jgi:hypothetical protein
MLVDLNIDVTEPMKIFCDNQVARHIETNPVLLERTKYIEVDYHFIREKVQWKEIETPFVRSEDQLANIFILYQGSKHQDIREYLKQGMIIWYLQS